MDGSAVPRLFYLPLLLIALLLSGCGPYVATRDVEPRILAMGDSMMTWHSTARRSIPDAMALELGEPVVNRSMTGAKVLHGLPISGAMGMKIANQYQKGDWDWVVLNGGGNDLWLGCGCERCDARLNRLISEDGRKGAIPKLVWTLRQTGAQVVYLGYLRSPGINSLIEHCREEGAELEARIAKLAELVDGVHFLSMAGLVPHGDRSYHALDMIHPSRKASSVIGRSVAALIRRESGG